MDRRKKSEHLLTTEEIDDDTYRQEHDTTDDDPSPGLVHERKRHVHSVEARNQSRRHQKHRHKGEDLHDAVLIEIDETDNGVLEIFKSLEAEIRVVDQRCDVLENDGEAGLEFRRIFVALHQVADESLLVDDILADSHRVLLKLIDVDEEFFVDVLLLIDPLAELSDLLAHELNHVGIEVDTLVHDCCEDGIAGREKMRHGIETPLDLRETAERNLPEGCKTVADEYERDGFHRIVLRARHQEVGVGEYGVLSLREAGRALDFLGLRPALDLLTQETVHRVLFFAGRREHVYP